MKYDDLLSVPYKDCGRDMAGMDCYGLLIECARRDGKVLRDFIYEGSKVSIGVLESYAGNVNIRQVQGAKQGRCVQCEYNGMIHVGYMISDRECIHMTYEGVRRSPIIALKNCTYYEVTE